MPEPTAADYALVDAQARVFFDGKPAEMLYRVQAALAVAACRAEYEAKLADERKHADEETKADAEGWRNGQAQVQRDFDLLYADHQALKARLALAEAVCESCGGEWDDANNGDVQWYSDLALSAWRAAK